MPKRLKISIYGIGNFGFALLKHLSPRTDGGEFCLHAYDHNEKFRRSLKKDRKHPVHHKHITISRNVVIEDNVKDLIKETDILILAVTSEAIKKVTSQIRPFIDRDIIILNVAKALDPRTGERPSEIISRSLKGTEYSVSIAMFAGGTIARDLFYNEPLGADIACEDRKALKLLKKILTTENLNIYTTDDLEGVEYAAAFKNAISILAGMMHGLGFSYGSETHIISRVAREVEMLVLQNGLGGKKKTFSMGGQCWSNDMWMSATGNTRNREFGILLGKGYSPLKALEIMKKNNKTVEGTNTIRAIKKIVGEDRKKYPLLYHMHEIVFLNKNPRETILELMASNKI